MDDIDKVIKKYGYQSLISEIVRRQQGSSYFGNVKRRGAPRTMLGDLWGLQDVFNHYKTKHPRETAESIADRVLKFLREYRSWEKRVDLYAKELLDNKDMYQKIKWIGNYGAKKIAAKTIVNKMSTLRKETLRFAGRAIDDSFTKAFTTNDLMEDEVFVDDPRDYL
jgi:hypothetical protein